VRKLLEISGAWDAFKSGRTAEELEADQQRARQAAEQVEAGERAPQTAGSGAGA
jgi:hypothetical protein